MNRYLYLSVVLVLILAAAVNVHAEAVTWNGDDTGGDQIWTNPDANSWSGGTYDNADTPTFSGAGAGAVIVAAGGVAPGNMTFSSGTYDIQGGAIGGSGQLTKSGSALTLSNTNLYTGRTVISSGTLTIKGKAALSPVSKIYMQRWTGLSLMMDDVGTVSLGNEVELNAIDTSSSQTTTYTITVGNNGGATTGSILALGLVDFFGGGGNPAGCRIIRANGANGYRLQVGNVDMNVASSSVSEHRNQGFMGFTAPITISGTVKQIDGNTGNTTANILYLGGTHADNLVTGTIANPNDYPANTNAQALKVRINGGTHYGTEASTWTFSGTNTYTGSTTINRGKLVVNGSTATGAVAAVNTGILGGSGTVGGEVTLSSTAGISTLDGAVGVLTLCNNLHMTGAADAHDFFFDLGTSNNGTDKIVVTGNVTMVTSGSCVIQLNQLSGTKIDAGTNDLIAATGTMPAIGDFKLATTSAFGNEFSLQLDGTAKILQLVVAPAPPAPPIVFWTGSAANNNWSSLDNWSTNVTGSPAVSVLPGYDSDVRFYANGAARLTSGSLDSNFDINSLTYLSNLTANTTINGSQALILEAASGTGVTVNIPLFGSTPVNTIACEVALASSQTWAVHSNASLTVSGVVSDFSAGNALTKTGVGNVMLSGLNTYSGATVIEEGTLKVWHYSLGNAAVPSALGMSPADAANLVLNPGTTLEFVLSGDSYKYCDRSFTINGTAPGDSASLRTSSSGNRGVNLSNTGSPAYGTPDQTRTLILTGTHSTGGTTYQFIHDLRASIGNNGSGAVTVVKNGVGTWKLSGNSSYSGGTMLNQGTLRLGVNNNCLGTGTLTMNGGSVSMDDSRSLANAILLSSNGTINTFSYSLTLSGAISGPGTLTKSGSGTMTLTGTNNTYSGDTIVGEGKLTLTTDHSLPRSTTLYLPAVNPTVALNLNFVGWHRITDLYIDGVRQPRGIYGDDGATIEGTGYIVTGEAGSIFSVY